uniref:Rho GTPase-activating protein 12 n=1 Tax=Phallusia mammillata TaxID=59560 RepID=A0A6F9D7H7_9ASCI|nr:rho GTPase-activating protein 12 [Phallusia mammillata]
MSSINADDLGRVVKVEYSYKYKANDGRYISIEEGEEFILVKKSNADWWQVIRLEEKKPIYIPAAYVKETTLPKRYPEHPYFKKAYQALQKSKKKQRSLEPIKKDQDRPLSRAFHSGNERLIAVSGSREDLTVVTALPGDNKLSELRASCDSLDRFIENENPYDEVPYEPSHKFSKQGKTKKHSFEEPEYENLETIQKSVDDQTKAKSSSSPRTSEKDSKSPSLKSQQDKSEQISSKEDKPRTSTDPSPRKAGYEENWELHLDNQTGSKYYYETHSGAMRTMPPRKKVPPPSPPQSIERIHGSMPVPPPVPDVSKKPSFDRSRLSPHSDEDIQPVPLQRRRTSPARYKNSHRSPLISRANHTNTPVQLSPNKDNQDPWSPIQNMPSPTQNTLDGSLELPNNNNSNNRSSFTFSQLSPDAENKTSKHKKALSDSNKQYPEHHTSPLSSKRSSQKSRSSSFTTEDLRRLSPSSSKWRREMSPDGEVVFIHDLNGDRWHQMVDDTSGNYYYFNELTRQTSWQLPESDAHDDVENVKEVEHFTGQESDEEPEIITKQERSSSRKANTLERDTVLHVKPLNDLQQHTASLPPNASLAVASPVNLKPRHGRTFARQVDRVMHARSMIMLSGTSNMSSPTEEHSQHDHNPLKTSLSECDLLNDSPGASRFGQEGDHTTVPPPHPMIERQGRLNWTKLMDAGKKQRKNWVQQWVVLLANNLLFYKDQKQAIMTKSTPHGKPESSCDLRGATIDWAKDKSSKKNVVELQTVRGLSLLLQHDDQSTIKKWLNAVKETIQRANHVDPLDPYILHDRLGVDEGEEENDTKKNKKDKKKKTKPPSRHGSDAKNSDKVRTKLKKFIGRRPTMESLQERGIIQESVFGCPLEKLCEKEQSFVPKFIQMCVEEVEKRGLDVDGIYRVSGNLSHVQKLRYMIDRDEKVDLSEPQWEDIHLITGALKMFLRELPEPVIPFNFFDKFIASCKIQDERQRIASMKSLVRVLPKANGKTLKYLMKHFCKVVEHSSSNRMQVQNVAIVFGPTLLLKPPDESPGGGAAGHMHVYMVYQNQIVDYMLTEYEVIFGN